MTRIRGYGWYRLIKRNCSQCNSVETQEHIIYECKCAQDIWESVSRYLKRNITLHIIVFGIKGDKTLNNLLSQISYSIHKYWIARINNMSIFNHEHLLRTINRDLVYKSHIMRILNEHQIADAYKNVSNFLNDDNG